VVNINNIRIHIVHIIFIACLTACMFIPLKAQAQNEVHANAKVELSSSTLTPGQKLNLTIDVNYLDDVEIFFDLNQHNWQPFTLLAHNQNEPTWHNNQWHVKYVVTLIAPLAGEYQLPKLTLHSYLQQFHQTLNINIPAIGIRSSFPVTKQAAELQPVEKFTAQINKEATYPTQRLAALLIALCLISLVCYLLLRNKNRQDKTTYLHNPTPIVADNLIAMAEESGQCNWQALREYMLQQLCFDPLKEHTDSRYLELSNRYTSARFSANNQISFIALCQDCQLMTTSNKEKNNA